jgi:hypothetical protein
MVRSFCHTQRTGVTGQMSLSAPKLPTSYSNKLKEIVKRRIETFYLTLETSIFCLERRQSSQQLGIWQKWQAPSFGLEDAFQPRKRVLSLIQLGARRLSSPTCVKIAVRIRLQSARSIINHQSSMHYEIFRNLSAVFLWVLSKTIHTMI